MSFCLFFCFSSLKYLTDKGSDKVIKDVTSYLDIMQNLAEEMLDTVAEYRAVIAERNEDITEKKHTQKKIFLNNNRTNVR